VSSHTFLPFYMMVHFEFSPVMMIFTFHNCRKWFEKAYVCVRVKREGYDNCSITHTHT